MVLLKVALVLKYVCSAVEQVTSITTARGRAHCGCLRCQPTHTGTGWTSPLTQKTEHSQRQQWVLVPPPDHWVSFPGQGKAMV